MSKIVISADSTVDLSEELVEKFHVNIIPLYVTLGEKTLKDTVEIKADDIYDFVSKTKQLPKTSACSIDDYRQLFNKLTKEGNAVIHFNIASGMSSTHQNALIAAQEVDGEVYVVDSANLSTGIAHLVIDTYNLINEGKSAAEVYEEVKKRISKVRASFVVDKLEYLRMGGRCSSVALLGANVLQIKPCIEVVDGVMGVASKYRGPYKKVILQYVDDKLTKTENIKKDKIFVTHTKCDREIVDAVIKKVKEYNMFENIYETEAGCVVTSHCGPSTLGILFEVE